MTKTLKYDALVVGAGPAGSTAAHVLAGAGMRVALVEKHPLPREKLCGGMVTGRCRAVWQEVFGPGWEEICETRSQGLSFYKKDRLLKSVSGCPPVYFTTRRDFDMEMARRAARQGAEILEASPVLRLEEGRRLVLRDGRTLEADFLIGADGETSRVAAGIFPQSHKKRGRALALEVEIPKTAAGPDIADPEIYLDIARWGYGWVFPKKNHYTVGIGGPPGANKNLKAALARLVHHRFGVLPPEPVRGAFLPFGAHKKTPGKGRVLLCGDAAGFVDPVSGEGIAHAMASGQYAAQSVLEAARAGRPETALARYRIKCRPILDLLDQAGWVRFFTYPRPAQPLFFFTLWGSRTAVKVFMRVMDGSLDYKSYLALMVRQAPRDMLRLPNPL